MSENEYKMYKELLELLEKRREENEIDKENYEELKERYTEKLEIAKEFAEKRKATPRMKVAGAQTISDTVASFAGSVTINGGNVDRDIRVAGSAKFSDDIICNNLKAAGSVRSAGNITAHGNVKTSGSFKCEGFLHADYDVNVAGSCKVGSEVLIGGKFGSSGSFSCGGDLQAENGIRIAGSSKVEGNMLSQSTVSLAGRTQIEGNLVGEDVGINKDVVAHRLKRSRPSIVKGSVFGTKEVILRNTIVEQDVKGVFVEIGPFSEVKGTVYYVEKVDIDDKAKLHKEPVKISYEKLKL
ncbi:MAG: polymer-forming cytoskeletal protein [Asgard group archaeon]|nr:polymer-forming cytoskeletal protein [Asgard group archaeon]